MTNAPKIAVLISGSGTTLRNLIRKIGRREVDVDIRLVISSNPSAAGLQFAKEAGIETLIVQHGEHTSAESFSNAIFMPCRAQDVRLVVMGGFLKHVLIPPDFVGRVMNVHPSLIPAFCGQGYYGRRVHAAVLEYGARISGCTVHFVDDHFDHGPIIDQRSVSVLDEDTAETLAARVFALECEAYPAAIQLFVHGRLHIDGRRVRVV